jgi:hypothetical protein
VYWDQMLNKGYVMTGLATDDLHKSPGIGKAWTMIKADKLDNASILDALEKGSFYASSGPEILDYKMAKGKKIKIECSGVQKIAFRINGAGNGKVFTANEGEDLQSAEWDLSKKKPKWVRCEVTDKDGNTAWTNPIFL